MSDQLLTVLKLCLLALLYLFFFRVVRAVWAEISAPAPAMGAAPPKTSARQPQAAPAPPPAAPPGPKPAPVSGQLVVVDPPELRGATHGVGAGLTVGRAEDCDLVITDSFSSGHHARVSGLEGQYVVEDLGSTNGTFLNGQQISAPTAMNAGDRIQIGNTVLELV